MLDAHDWCYGVVRTAIADGHQPFREMWHAGRRGLAQRTRLDDGHGDEMRARSRSH